jgi:hypothetical protein
MTTVELIRNNPYRAAGSECWLSTYSTEDTKGGNRLIRPKVYKVTFLHIRVTGDGPTGDVVVQAKTGGRRIYASPDDLHNDRETAMNAAVAQCKGMHMRPLPFSNAVYVFNRPEPKPAPAEYRVVASFEADGPQYSVQYREPAIGSRRWKPVVGLFRLTKWKAADCVKRLVAGDEIPGYWRVGTTMEFIELADNVE